MSRQSQTERVALKPGTEFAQADIFAANIP